VELCYDTFRSFCRSPPYQEPNTGLMQMLFWRTNFEDESVLVRNSCSPGLRVFAALINFLFKTNWKISCLWAPPRSGPKSYCNTTHSEAHYAEMQKKIDTILKFKKQTKGSIRCRCKSHEINPLTYTALLFPEPKSNGKCCSAAPETELKVAVIWKSIFLSRVLQK
jgi:hypothetical protein